jgi:hypothetical protein
LIVALWEYSTNLWKFRNGTVYGQTKEEKRNKALQALQAKFEYEYKLYATNNFIISPQFASLFTKNSLKDRMSMGQDSISCWIQSVDEAKRHQLNFCQSLATVANRFFHPKPTASVPSHSAKLSVSLDFHNGALLKYTCSSRIY